MFKKKLALDFNAEVLASGEQVLEAALGVEAEARVLLDDIASLWHFDALLLAQAVDGADILFRIVINYWLFIGYFVGCKLIFRVVNYFNYSAL